MWYRLITSAIAAAWVTTYAAVGRGAAPSGATGTRVYALIVGNNTPPAQGDGAPAPLRYADDDAFRFYQFFEHITAKVRMFTVPDPETQRRFREITAKAGLPTVTEIRRAATRFGRRIEKDRQAGFKTVVYIVFSGHGAYTENGDIALVLLDGFLTREVLYRDILGRLNADFQHLFIDACYAEGVVGTRGLFDRESAKNDFQKTDLQRSAEEANRRYVRFGNAVWISAGFVPIGLAAGFLLRPPNPHRKKDHKVELNLLQSANSFMLNVTF
jgi:hypothetical protein